MTEPAAANVTALPAVQGRKAQDIRVVSDPIPVLDTARFEHMQRIATVMAHSSLVPDALCKTKVEGQRETVPLEPQEIVSNCFLVVNQAVRWGMDPFAVAQCVSVVHGKLCYEGKLIAAVIEAKLGIRLKYTWDEKPGDNLGIVVSGKFPDEDEARTVTGTVGEWKTTGAGTPWTAKQSRKMLAYRGAREWARLHAPSIMLGVYSDDELDALSDERRSRVAVDVTPRDHAPPLPPPLAANEAPQPGCEIADEVEPEPQPSVVWTETSERPATEADGIPKFLDRRERTAAEATAADVFDGAQWLADLDGALSGCEDFASLSDVQTRVMMPAKGKALPPDWERAQHLINAHLARVNQTVLAAG